MIRLLSLFFLILGTQACSRRQTNDGFVCVCNGTYCDTVPSLGELGANAIKIFSTSALEPGFTVKEAIFTSSNESVGHIRIDADTKFQKILGFGGAFTDATGINIKRLPEEAQKKLLESYFGSDGIGYNLCRVPIGGTDFSPRPYSLDDVEGDQDLKNFKLQDEDNNYKIPFIKLAKELRGDNPLNLFGTAWTAPTWMKTDQIWSRGFSMLKEENYQLWANYIKKFLDEYEKQDIKFWGLTTGNEPLNGFYSDNGVNSMGWTPLDHARWIAENLGPTIRNSSHRDIKIMIHDESTLVLPFVVPVLLNDDQVVDMIDGVATHWYWDSTMDPRIKVLAHTDKKDLFLLSTESSYFQTQPLLGSWERAAGYILSIIGYLEFGFGGWIDWNMALNTTGGFTYIDVPADSPIIISEDSKEFYKQPLFFAMGHFSKFVLPNSVRLNVSIDVASDDVQSVAFLRPDNLTAVVVFNNGGVDVSVQIEDGNRLSANLNITANSLNTIIYSN